MSIETINLWHQRARPKPTEQNFSVQLGCHFEEIAEMLECLHFSPQNDVHGTGKLLRAQLETLANKLKQGTVQATVTDRKGLLDSLADQIVTGVGVGHCAGMQVTEAVQRVDSSNWSKFDADGQPIFDANGKIKKGPNYKPADLEGLV